MGANGQVSEQPVHMSGGDWARRIFAGALTGAASGGAAPVHPGGGGLAGLGAGLGLAEEVVNEDLGMDFLLDVEGRRGHDQGGPIRVVFAAPDELGVEDAIAALVLAGGN